MIVALKKTAQVTKQVGLLPAFLTASTLLFPLTVAAQPSPIAPSLVQEIRQKLPPGLSLRLPSYLPEEATYLQPKVKATDTFLQLYLVTDSECFAEAQKFGQVGCSAAHIFTRRDLRLKDWLATFPDRRNLSVIQLKNGIHGYFFMLGPSSQHLYWEQDGQVYGIDAPATFISRKELISIASSITQGTQIKGDR